LKLSLLADFGILLLRFSLDSLNCKDTRHENHHENESRKLGKFLKIPEELELISRMVVYRHTVFNSWM